MSMETLKAALAALEDQRNADREQNRVDLLEKRQAEEECLAAFRRRAQRTMDEIVEPRLRLLTAHFDDVSFKKNGNEFSMRVDFNTARNLGATVWLEFTQSLAPDEKLACLQYRLEILPIYFDFERTCGVACSLAAPDDAAFIAFVESRLTAFMAIYMRLEKTRAYQRS